MTSLGATMTRSVRITDFLTQEEIVRAMRLYNKASPGTFASRCAEEIIAPVIDRINQKLGQENDPRYLGYAVEHVFNASVRKH
jgi:hypothetical protein